MDFLSLKELLHLFMHVSCSFLGEGEDEDKEPEGDENSIRIKKLRLKYKPKDFKEALLLQRLVEGDEQLIMKITDAELSRQG